MTSFSYPPPNLIVELDFEALRQQRIAAFLASWTEFQAQYPEQELPDYDTQTIDSEQAMIALRAAAWGDLHFIARSNDVSRAALLADFAKDGDLDLHGVATRLPGFPDGVARHPGESDDSYAARIIEARAGVSAAGPDEWWLRAARAADSRVRSIGLYYRGKGLLDIFLLSGEDGGQPDAAMLAAVTARLTRDDVRPRNVQPTIRSAIIAEIDIVADIWLLPDAPDSRLDAIKAAAFERHAREQALDVDLTHHYLKRLLDAPDVYKVTIVTPETDLVADPSRAWAIRSIDLRLVGRAR